MLPEVMKLTVPRSKNVRSTLGCCDGEDDGMLMGRGVGLELGLGVGRGVG